MKLLQFFQYAYLIFAVLFIYDGIANFNEGNRAWISFALAALAIFMFFFRKRYREKFEARRREREESNK
ncbi:hypothetical protein SAMN03097699_3175 [Flavobacteriaceae bacterium MAR_2010_188]|nr:hypothetical protein SAMN03097699_3175 [Flavobacteriaceae bacterium MAR_2010_188]